MPQADLSELDRALFLVNARNVLDFGDVNPSVARQQQKTWDSLGGDAEYNRLLSKPEIVQGIQSRQKSSLGLALAGFGALGGLAFMGGSFGGAGAAAQGTGYTALPSGGMIGTGGVSASEAALGGVGASTGAAGAAGSSILGTGTVTAAEAAMGGVGAAGAAGTGGIMSGLGDFVSNLGLGDIGSLANTASSVLGLFSGGSGLLSGDTGNAAMADPFASQRPQYQAQLAALMSNPGKITTSPLYQFAFNQGLDAVNRTAAAKGLLGSGNRLAELTQYGQGMAGQQFFQMANLLGNLAGSQAGSPAAAANIAEQRNQANWQAVAQGLGGLSSTFGSSAYGGGAGNSTYNAPSAVGDYSAFFGPDPTPAGYSNYMNMGTFW